MWRDRDQALALGALHRESQGGFLRVSDYDGLGRVSRVSTTINGNTYTQRLTYDAFGRAFQSFDASTDANSPKGQLVQYSSDGFPIRIREAANGLLGVIYRETLALSPRGQVRRERLWESGGPQNVYVNRVYDEQTGRLTGITAGLGSSADNADRRLQDWTYVWDKNAAKTRPASCSAFEGLIVIGGAIIAAAPVRRLCRQRARRGKVVIAPAGRRFPVRAIRI